MSAGGHWPGTESEARSLPFPGRIRPVDHQSFKRMILETFLRLKDKMRYKVEPIREG